MEIRFVEPTLEQMEQINCEALAIPFFRGERPLHGAFGLMDWRMCGLISRMMIKNHIQGHLYETILFPGHPRFGIEKLFLFGLGAPSDFQEDHPDQVSELILDTLTRANVRTSAMVLPGRSLKRIKPSDSIERFLSVAAKHQEHDIVTILEDSTAQKEMEPVVEQERRKARAFSV